MLVEAYLHDKFIFKTCLMHPEFYARLMRDEQAKYHIDYMSPINELVLYGIPVKITPEVETISWIMDLDE